MNNQATFDKIAKHLLTQMERSVDKKGTCLYRGPRGLKCAIGAILPEGFYHSSYEGKSVRLLTEQFGLQLPIDIDLVQNLQTLHDTHTVNVWAEELLNFAIHYDLDPSVVMGYMV